MNEKYLRKQGGWESQIVQSIRKIGQNEDVSVELATVSAVSPSLSIIMDRDGLPIDTDDVLYVAEHLTEHIRKMSFSLPVSDGGTATASNTDITIHGALSPGDRVFVVIDGDAYYVIDKAVTY